MDSEINENIKMYLCLFLFGVLLAGYLQFHSKRKKLHLFSKEIPSPSALPIIGHVHLLLKGGNGKVYIIKHCLHFTSE